MTASTTDIGAFLRARRAHLAPGDVGLRPVAGERRRTPGLRREEVAQLCGVSATWYTWLEQGRPISMSPTALARLATVLRLSRAERTYLFDLARKRDPRSAIAEPDAAVVPTALASLLETTTAPAYCLDLVWRACAWNAAAGELFAGWLGGPEPNLLRWMFLDPAARSFVVDWEERGSRLVAEFRAHAGGLPDAPEIAVLVAALRRESPAFSNLWSEQIVRGREGGLRRFDHPRLGSLTFEQVTLVPTGHETFKIVILLPAEECP